MSECERAAVERGRLDQEQVKRVLARITVRRRVYTPARARRRRFWMRVKWLDDHTGRRIVPPLYALVMRGGWRRGS